MNKLQTTIAQGRRRQQTIKLDRCIWGKPQVISNVEWAKPKNRKEIDEWHDKHVEERKDGVTRIIGYNDENTKKSKPL